MSRKSDNRAAAALAREAETRQALFEFDQRMADRAEQDRRANREFLLAAKQELARDRLEAQAADLDAYRQQTVAHATSSKTIAPQFVPFIMGTSREEIDAQIEQAKASTAEIAAEITGQIHPQGDVHLQARDAATGLYIPAEQPANGYLPSGMTVEEIAAAANGSLDMTMYTRMRDRLGFANSDAGLFS